MYMFELPLSRARSALERKLTLITKMDTSNCSIIHSLHDSHLHLWQSWQNRWEYCCPLGQMKKMKFWDQQDSHSVSPRTQIESDCSGEHIKREPLPNPSKLIFSLTLKFHPVVHIGPQSQIMSKYEGGKYTFEICGMSPRAQIFAYSRDEHIKRKP